MRLDNIRTLLNYSVIVFSGAALLNLGNHQALLSKAENIATLLGAILTALEQLSRAK